MLPVITRIAQQIDRQWAAAGYRPDGFPALAARALEDNEPPDLTELAESLSGGLTLPRQRRLDQSFGQPALTLHHGERFVVEALCWHSGSPAIHQHSFCGAFRVMTGRSVHSCYQFSERERVAAGVAVGDLKLVATQVLDRTAVTPIPAGAALIHSAFHLDNPSMTVIVRTHDSGDPEYTYLPPGVAFDPSARSETLHKRLQLLDTLDIAGHPSYGACVRLAVDSTDVYEGMEILLRVHNHRLPPPVLEGLTGRYVRRHGPRVQPLIDAVREQQRRSHLLALRATTHEPGVRYVLACLLNAFDRASFTQQLNLTSLDTGAPDAVAACLRQVLGMAVDAEPVLGLAGTAMLQGLEPGTFPGWVAEQAGEPIGEEQGQLLEKLYRQLLDSPLLTPMHS